MISNVYKFIILGGTRKFVVVANQSKVLKIRNIQGNILIQIRYFLLIVLPAYPIKPDKYKNYVAAAIAMSR